MAVDSRRGDRQYLSGAEDARELVRQLGAIETSELDAFHSACPLLFGEERQQRVAPVELVGPIRRREDDRSMPKVAAEEPEQVQRGLVRPVDVLDDGEQRRALGNASQEAEDVLEEASLADPSSGPSRSGSPLYDRPGIKRARFVRSAPRTSSSSPGGKKVRKWAKGFDDRPERDALRADGDAAAFEHHPTGRAPCPRDLAHEACLADAGLARHEHDRGPSLTRGGEDCRDTVELVPTADEDRARYPIGHDGNCERSATSTAHATRLVKK